MSNDTDNKPSRTELVDFWKRKITYLRVSLTNRCNFRCKYCYGNPDLKIPKDDRLPNEYLIRLIEITAFLGINKIRFTGGEPLLRRDIIDLIANVSSIEGIKSIGITTNGYYLAKYLPDLATAGLSNVNISLDTLNKDTFKAITGVDGFEKVYLAIELAEQSGYFPLVKVNTVVMRSINDMEMPRFTEWALKRKIDLRFIEFMPTADSGWGKNLFVGEDEMREKIRLNLEADPESGDNIGPARRYRYKDYPGRISFISAVSHNFCDSCNRLRLTANGDLIGCLFGRGKLSLGNMMKKGLNNIDIMERIFEAVGDPEFKGIRGGFFAREHKPLMRSVGG